MSAATKESSKCPPRTTNRFTAGTGAYVCRICARKTRDTGRGDSESVGLCAECYTLASEENYLSDNDGCAFSPSPEEVLRMLG